jgi:hypothetical protein
VVGSGDTKNHPGALGTLLDRHVVRPSPDETPNGYFSAGGLVPLDLSDFRRRFGVGAKGAVGAGGDFSRVAWGCRGGKSPAGVDGTLDRRTLLRGLMAKVELREHEDVKKSRDSIKSESDFTLSLAAKTRQPAIRAHLRGIRQKEIKLFLRQPVLPGVIFVDEVSASGLGEAALKRLG